MSLWMLVEFIVCTVIGYYLHKNTACVAHISGSVYLTAQLIFVCQLDVSWMVWPIRWVPFCYHSIVSSSNVCLAEAHTHGSWALLCMPSHARHKLLNVFHIIHVNTLERKKNCLFCKGYLISHLCWNNQIIFETKKKFWKNIMKNFIKNILSLMPREWYKTTSDYENMGSMS